ncbi:response regulator transcription factor [Streptomyces sp. CRN 30]|uniref:helix-turn-helix transcriptional regulator n=1 Tax=Streptomyces sp. CRN 30 TaxID=3075613 RepID=UPI002A81B2F8|nr:response regulator transcription factor [Streptomyces sp. CRN 30]
MGSDEVRRRALEERFAGLDGFVVRPHDREPLPEVELVVAAVDRDSMMLAHRYTSHPSAPHAPTLFVADEPFRELSGAMWFGARGIALSTAPDRELADAALLVTQGCTVMAEEVLHCDQLSTGNLAFEWTVNRDARATLSVMSEREREVLALIGSGRDNTEIADLLWVSVNTVRSHVQRLMRKLGLRNRLCLVIFALELGLVDLDDTVVAGARAAASLARQK